MATRSGFRPRPLDVNKPLNIVRDVSELDAADGVGASGAEGGEGVGATGGEQTGTNGTEQATTSTLATAPQVSKQTRPTMPPDRAVPSNQKVLMTCSKKIKPNKAHQAHTPVLAPTAKPPCEEAKAKRDPHPRGLARGRLLTRVPAPLPLPQHIH